MKFLIYLLFPTFLFAQEKNDTINSEIKANILKSYYQMNAVVKNENSFVELQNELQTRGKIFRKEQYKISIGESVNKLIGSFVQEYVKK